MRILVTRPQYAADATSETLKALGHDAIVAPLMKIRFRDGDALTLDGVQAILATSGNGALAVARRTARRDVPLFAVGKQTAGAARAAGFTTVRSADGDGADLASAAARWARPDGGALLHAAGAQTKGDLAAALTSRGFTMRTEILYEAVAATSLPAPANEALRNGTLDAVMLFSPRGARVFAELAERAGLGTACAGVTALCISQASAQALGDLAFRAILVAKRPDQDGMLALVGGTARGL
ncbi:MAG TPA: uroporphyrinogen-III synthase [Rhizomicrobium sp.]|jgi:uroporphyrinogen-III synthase|nr:uroporphyrinogen-III synthase [Rhizomicrobium sp.]